jgi:WD40-like Beta Propeller Repeat
VWLTDALAARPLRLMVADARHPKFSADGRFFTFTRNVTEVHVASIDGGEAHRVEGLPETPGFASPMAAMNAAGDIAFVLADEGPSGNVWVRDAATGNASQLTTPDNDFAGVFARSPVWTPDGRSIIFSAADREPANTHLWQVDLASSVVFRLTSGVGGYGEPALNNDGSTLVYSYAQPLWRLIRTDPDSGEERIIHESRTGIALPHVSRNGDMLVFFFDQLFWMPLAGGEPEQLSFGPTGEATLPVWSRSEDSIFYYKDRALHRFDRETGVSEPVLEDFHWSSRNWLAVHGDRLAYRLRSAAQSVILELQTGEEIVLDAAVLPTDWSRDGSVLLGRREGDHALLTCVAPDFSCAPVRHDGEPVDGAIPRWSSDESRIFFRRAHPSRSGYAQIWVVSTSGGEPRPLVSVGPYQPENMFFGVAADDSIIWNEYESSGRSEIWMAESLDAADRNSAGRSNIP